jgi:hypothetical protein
VLEDARRNFSPPSFFFGFNPSLFGGSNTMQATRALREKMATLLAADATSLAPATDLNVIKLVMATFTPGESTVVGDLTFATFDGSTPIEVTAGTQAEGLDPLTADAVITLSPPVGGFRFEVTGTTNLPQQIFGCALVSDAGVLLGCQTLPQPITLTAVNQFIDLGDLSFRQLANSLT